MKEVFIDMLSAVRVIRQLYHELEGDIAIKEQDAGKASQKYEEAIYFDPHCTEAYLKYADSMPRMCWHIHSHPSRSHGSLQLSLM